MDTSKPAPIDDYIADLSLEQQRELGRIKAIVLREIPSIEQGISYAIPTYLYEGKPLFSCMVNKKFISIYPFSGKVIEALRGKLEGFELTAGSIHFTIAHPLPDSLITEIILMKKQEIDVKRFSR